MSENLSTALDDQARLLATKRRANDVARILSEAAVRAGGIADSGADGNSALATAAKKAEDLVAVVLGALDEIRPHKLATQASEARQACVARLDQRRRDAWSDTRQEMYARG